MITSPVKEEVIIIRFGFFFSYVSSYGLFSAFYFPNFFLNASVNAGTTWNRSPTTP